MAETVFETKMKSKLISKQGYDFGVAARQRGAVRNVYLDQKCRKTYDEVPEHQKETFRMGWTQGWNNEHKAIEMSKSMPKNLLEA